MHIAEGVLSGSALIAGAGATALGTAAGLKKMEDEDIPQVAVVAAALFVASLIHIPLGPTTVHLVLNAIAGILLGWKVFPAFLAAIFLQSILFQFGGLIVVGVNTLLVAFPAVLVHYLFLFLVKNKKNKQWLGIGGFICGAVSILATAILLMGALLFTHESFYQLARLILASYLPLMIIEGLITAFCLLFLYQVKPEIIADKAVEIGSLKEKA